MLEKDIENLIADYPKEFFPKEEFTLISQQHSVKGRRIDVLFEDKYGRYIIVEVKRGILSRESAGQIIEYYGLLKSIFPEKTIELILCANTVPPERKTFLENVGINCVELSLKKIFTVAEKYQYNFLDAKKFRNEKIKYNEIQRSVDSKRVQSTVWIFQANPREYDILNALSDKKIGNKCHWYVGQHKRRIKKGHLALIWMSGKESGIYAVTQILSDPALIDEYEEEKKYWLNTNKETSKLLRVRLSIIKRLINYPIFRYELKKIPGLSDLSILNYWQGTNFPVKSKEWEIIFKIIKERSSYKFA